MASPHVQNRVPIRPPTPKPDYVIPDFGKLWTPRITYLENGWGVAIATIGPALAEFMLALNADNQRNLIPSAINRYAEDMTLGNWILTHQGIAFNIEGRLFDGQNRLHGVIGSGAEADFIVFFGAGGQREMAVLDMGRGRTACDAGHVLGMTISKDMVATVKQCLTETTPGMKGRGLTHSMVLAALNRYQAEVEQVTEWFSHRSKLIGIDRASVRGAVLAALVNNTSPELLKRFVGVYLDHIPATDPGDGAAKLLRQHIISGYRRFGGGSGVSSDLFLRTCRAIQYAMEGVNPGRLYAAASNPFPITSPTA